MPLGEDPTTPGGHPVPAVRTFSERKKAAFLTALGETGSIRGASSRAGVHYSTVYDHAKTDPTFADAIQRARGEWEQGLVEKIAAAGTVGKVVERRGGTTVTEPGDWRALAWLLEHSPATREQYAGVLRQKVELGGSDDLPPIQVEETVVHEVGPDTMSRLAEVVAVLVRAGKLRLPDPGEVFEGTATEVDPSD